MNRGLISGGSYSFMDVVYRGTTTVVPKEKLKVKKMLGLKGLTKKKLEPLINQTLPFVPEKLTETDAEERKSHNKMTTVTPEETALLGMDDIELRNFRLQFPGSAQFSGGPPASEVRVHTNVGEILVAIQGDRMKHPIVTYHDIGLNYLSMQTFFNFAEMRPLLENFCVYHLTAPGQEENAPDLPEDYVYPTMEELANQVNYVVSFFGMQTFIGFGVGLGANVLTRYALSYPMKVDALMLINCSSTQAGWIEWAYQKMNSRALRTRGMTQSVIDYLMWYHLGRSAQERNQDLVKHYHLYFDHYMNPGNLGQLIDTYVRRSDLGISRDADTIKVPVMNITGALSPHAEDTVTFNGRMRPTVATWMKISDCAMVIEEQPAKIAEVFRLFLQGEGFVAPLSPARAVAFEGVRRRACRHSPVIRITENPISEAVVC